MSSDSEQPTAAAGYDQPQSALIAGCGYLGLRAAQFWQQQGLTVSAITRSEQRADSFSAQGLQPVVCDLSDAAQHPQLPAADVVLWAVGFDYSSNVPRELIWLDGLQRLIRSLSSAPSRFVYVSSTSVYGQGAGETVDEHSPVQPVTEGGTCCAQAEQLAQQELAARFPDCQLVVLRMAGIFGPDRLLRRIQDLHSESPIAGEPEGLLNLIHVDDAVRMVHLAVTADEFPSVVNVVNSGSVTRRTYYSRLGQLISAPPPVFGSSTEPTRRTRGGNKRVTSTFRGASAANFRFNDVLSGLQDAIDRSDLPAQAVRTSPANPETGSE